MFWMALPAIAAAAGEQIPANADYQIDGCQATVFTGKNFAGESWTTSQGWADVGNKGQARIASIKVQQGVWRFFAEPAYGGPHQDLVAGDEIDTGTFYRQRRLFPVHRGRQEASNPRSRARIVIDTVRYNV